MSETAQQLRARADALEQEAENAQIRKGFWCGYVYDRAGRCFEEWLIDGKCSDHTEPYTDEYDYGKKYCRNCRNAKGTIKIHRRIRAPRYDARPPEEAPA
jgi:hypothetical protein